MMLQIQLAQVVTSSRTFEASIVEGTLSRTVEINKLWSIALVGRCEKMKPPRVVRYLNNLINLNNRIKILLILLL